MTIVALVPDLMDRSRLGSDERVTFARTVSDVVDAGPRVAFIDLSRVDDAAVADLVAACGEVVAFGPHVDDDRLAAAEQAGCVAALPRSVFFRRFGALLDTYADR